MASAEERETIVNACDADDTVRIWTMQRKHITKLRRHPSVTEVASGEWDGSVWVEFAVAAESWSPVGIRRPGRKLNEMQKAAAAERLRLAREKKSA